MLGSFQRAEHSTVDMNKVKAGLRGLSASDKLVKGQVVLKQMSGNPHFPNPEPTMAELQAACTELEIAYREAEDRGHRAIFRKQQAVEVMDSYLTRLAGYANSAALGDAGKLLSSGFELVKRPEPISDLQRPGIMRNVRSFHSGQVDLRWGRVPGALVYELEQVIDPEAEVKQWQRVTLTSKPSFIIYDLVPNSRQIFRVRAIGTKTESPYSQELITKSAA